jgi:A/G-specific adenine glycosylase
MAHLASAEHIKKAVKTSPTMAGPALPDKGKTDDFRKAMLTWYDRHRRVLPWRAPAGRRTDPYLVWLSEIMLQQTTVGAVMPYFAKFAERWPAVTDLAAAADEDVMNAWAGLGYYSRARNLLKCARVVASDYGGRFPSSIDALKNLPGIGDYTSAAIGAIAFDLPATVIDGNVERVIARAFAIEEPLPAAKKPIRAYAEALSENRADRPGDFAQAMMDLGATICIPKNPRCVLCPLMNICEACKQNIQNDLPRRSPKADRPKKTGYAYWIDDGAGNILLCRRPEKGLLGGMAALPTSDWTPENPAPELPHPDAILNTGMTLKIRTKATIRHVFTHFELRLVPVTGHWPKGRKPPPGHYWAPLSDLNDWGLPSVFKKAALMMIK